MTEKEDFEKSMRQWILLDNKIRFANLELRNMRMERDDITESVCEYIQNHKLEKRKIEIQDSKIEYFENKEYGTLTYGYLEKRLAEIIPEKDQVEYIIRYLKEKRDIKTSPNLKRVFKKGMKKGTEKVSEMTGYETDV